MNAQMVEKFFIPFILSANALHTEQFKLITQSHLFLSALITSHSLAWCVAKAPVFQPLAVVTVNLLCFLVVGGADVDADGIFSRRESSRGFDPGVSWSTNGFTDGFVLTLKNADRLD